MVMPRGLRSALVLALAPTLVRCSVPLTEEAAARRLLRRELRLQDASRVQDAGSDPYRILPLPGAPSSFLVLLRGRSRVIVVGERVQISRETPRSPTAWDLVDGRFLFVGGELSSVVRCFEVDRGDLRHRFDLALPGVASVRDLLYLKESQRLLVVDSFRGILVEVPLPSAWREAAGPVLTPSGPLEEHPIGPGPSSLLRAGDFVITNLFLEHALLVVPLPGGRPALPGARRIEHDGPIWATAATVRDGSLWIAAAGVEDRPLDRTSGEFGFVDSFLFLYEIPLEPRAPGAPDPMRRWTRNLSELGVVTPKAVRFEEDPGELRLRVTGYGGERMALLRCAESAIELVAIEPAPPGIRDFIEVGGTVVAADPLLDRVVRIAHAPVPADTLWRERSSSPPRRRLGEALFYTTLLTPGNRTDEALSRFTCETCHFEGGIDGRIHFTGRDHVFATTKPLRGLENNVPLFSRAGDPTLASMVRAEFHVANQGRRDTFPLSKADHPWLADLEGAPGVIGPEEQRLAFLEYLATVPHLPNPWRAQGVKLSLVALRGLAVFRSRCADCHQAVPSTREGARTVPFERWREWLETDGKDLVWGAPFFSKAGIEPYVDPAGARVPSLRRVAIKTPYFTNGSSRSLRQVLERFRFRGVIAWHDASSVEDRRGSTVLTALTAEEIDELLALLQFF